MGFMSLVYRIINYVHIDNNSGAQSIAVFVLRHNISNCLPSLFVATTNLERARTELKLA